MIKIVEINTQFTGLHNWLDAPEEVNFLRSPHRHIFYVKVGVLVLHSDRDVEFFILKKEVDRYLKTFPRDLGQMSCEMIAEDILEYLEMLKYNPKFVRVSEDEENAALLVKE